MAGQGKDGVMSKTYDPMKTRPDLVAKALFAKKQRDDRSKGIKPPSQDLSSHSNTAHTHDDK